MFALDSWSEFNRLAAESRWLETDAYESDDDDYDYDDEERFDDYD